RSYMFFFFFQAEDGIRDFHVTGVQTCALPIFTRWWRARSSEWTLIRSLPSDFRIPARISWLHQWLVGVGTTVAVERPDAAHLLRSEERRVGKESRSRWLS